MLPPVRQDVSAEHWEAVAMPRKGFPRVTREQCRAATIRNLRGFRDTAVQYAKDALAQG